jgi:hypothetical protein
MPYEIEFLDLNLDTTEDRKKLKQLCEVEGWRPIWFDRFSTNDGKKDFSQHLIVVERGRTPEPEVGEG